MGKRPHFCGAYSYVRTFNFACKFEFFFSFIGRSGVKGLPFETAQCTCAPARENGRALTPTMFQKKKIFSIRICRKKKKSWLGMLDRGALIYITGVACTR